MKKFSKLNNKNRALWGKKKIMILASYLWLFCLEDGRAYYCLLSVLIFAKTYQIMQKKAFNILEKTFIAIINDLLVMVEYVKS